MKKKDGRIRGNLNAKRVDQSARSVITPDPYISIDQLGVPIKIAMNLTFPEIVNKNNFTDMQELVRKGPEEWPGSKYINKGGKNGRTINLKYCPRSDEANNLKIGDIVSGEGHITCGRCRNCLAGKPHLCPYTIGVGVNRTGAFAEYLSMPSKNIFAKRYVNRRIELMWSRINWDLSGRKGNWK